MLKLNGMICLPKREDLFLQMIDTAKLQFFGNILFTNTKQKVSVHGRQVLEAVAVEARLAEGWHGW